jgi:flagellar biosynthesis protein FlhF
MRKARESAGDDARLVSARRVSAPDVPAVYEVQVTPGPAEIDTGGLNALRREIESLRETISGLKLEREPVPPPAAPPEEEDDVHDETYEKWLDVLRRRGVGHAHARKIVETAMKRTTTSGPRDEFEALIQVLTEEFQSRADDEEIGSRSTVFVGPSGTGKTTVLSKVATDLVRRGERPILVTTDGESLAGEESLHAVADALDLRFETAFLAGQLESLVERSGRGESFLVDTPGRSPFVRDGVESLLPLVRAIPDTEVLLVIPATMDGEEASSLIEGFAPLGVDRVILTKLDELCRPGRIVDLAKAVTRPIARITYGRAVRGASAAPGDPRVVSRILGTTRSLEASA